jgi:hypothetical protein
LSSLSLAATLRLERRIPSLFTALVRFDRLIFQEWIFVRKYRTKNQKSKNRWRPGSFESPGSLSSFLLRWLAEFCLAVLEYFTFNRL